MNSISANSPKAVCTASQLRSKMDGKFRKILGIPCAVGPLDKYIDECYSKGIYDAETKDILYEINDFCDKILFTTEYIEVPSFNTLETWSHVVDRLGEK